MEKHDLYTDVSNLLQTYWGRGLFAIIFLIVVYTAITKPENIKTWVGWLASLLGTVFIFLRRKAIKFSIEGPCTKSLKKISRELPEVEIPELEIEWVNEDNLLTKLEEGKAIVKLKFSTDQSRNIIQATSIYVRDAFLNHTKPYLREDLRKAIDFSITKKILLNIGYNKINIISQFISDSFLNIDAIRDKYNVIEDIDDAGLFTRILLREYDYFGKKLFGRNPDREHFDEADRYLSFIYDISTRQPDDDTPLAYNFKFIKVGVVLVAKLETYVNYGLEPYLRRIKLGLAQGIETFYLLAREDKVTILKEIAEKILATGDFLLINNPREFKDVYNRDAICFCIRINNDSLLARGLRDINQSIISKETVKGIITRVSQDSINVNVNGIEGYVKKTNLSIIEIHDARLYFKTSLFIDLIPIEVHQNGVVEFSLKNTVSDPNSIIQTDFKIGKQVRGIITYIDDTFVKIDIGEHQVKGIAYRKDLTFSRFLLLHEKFHIGQEYDFIINSYNFEKGNIRLCLKDLEDPWKNLRISKKAKVDFLICKKNDKSFAGEIIEGVSGVLPHSELSWFESDCPILKTKFKLNQTVHCSVKDIDNEGKYIILTLKDEFQNPYKAFVSERKGDQVEFILKEISEFGINGIVQEKYSLYIPKYEQSWDGSHFKGKIGKKYNVVIKGIDKYCNQLIGTLKPLLPHPLKIFSEKYKEGLVLKGLSVKAFYDWGTVFNIRDSLKHYEAFLFNGDTSNLCFIKSNKHIVELLEPFPLMIKTVDFEKNRIVLSFKRLTAKNKDRFDSLSYDDEFYGIIIGEIDRQKYVVIVLTVWIECVFESANHYLFGDKVKIRPSLISDDQVIFTDF